MVINIDTKKVTSFIGRHKEGVFVGFVAVMLLRGSGRHNRELMEFIARKGLLQEYCATH